MPIGSKSYYDNVDASKKSTGGKLSLFRRGDQPALEDQAVVEAAPPAPSQAAATPASSPIDMVVTQIVELATRATAILNRAEELAKRAELILASVEEAAERAQAGAMRAELAASRTELNVMTSAIMESSAKAPEPAAIAVEEAPPVQDPMALLAERLRAGIQQIEDAQESVPNVETDENGASGTVFARMSALSGTNTISDTTRAGSGSTSSSRMARAKSGGETSAPELIVQATGGSDRDNSTPSRTTPPNQADAMAKSLVSVNHDHDIPRVSPYILHFSPKRDEGSSGMKTSKPSPHDNDPRNIAV